jgi:hypothetical protein
MIDWRKGMEDTYEQISDSQQNTADSAKSKP